MPSPVTCPSCGERLDIPADLRGTPVRCAACTTVFTPPPADDRDEVPEVRPAAPGGRRRSRSETPDDGEDRPRRSLTWLWVLFGGLGLMTCVCCGGCGMLVINSENPTFQPYASPDGRFTAEFPGTPVPQRLALGDGEPMKGVEARRDLFQETYFAYAGDVPKPPKDDRVEEFLQKAASDLVAAKGRPGRPTTKVHSAHGGYPAVEIHVEANPLEPASGLVARVILAGKRLYVIGVSGSIMPQQDRVAHFLQSFQITEAGEKKGADGKK